MSSTLPSRSPIAASSSSLRSPSTSIFTPPRENTEPFVAVVVEPSDEVACAPLAVTTSFVRKRMDTRSPSAVTRSIAPRSLRTSRATKVLTLVVDGAGAGVLVGASVPPAAPEPDEPPAPEVAPEPLVLPEPLELPVLPEPDPDPAPAPEIIPSSAFAS